VLTVNLVADSYSASPKPSANLGLSVSIIPQVDADQAPFQAGMPSTLAVTVEPGDIKNRKIRILSSSKNPELITTQIGYAKRVNGALTLDDRLVSPVKSWITFSEDKFILTSKKPKEIEIEIKVPEGEPTGVIQESYLLVLAQEVNPLPSQNSNVVGAARYAIPIAIGVGDTSQILTSFTVGIVTLVKTTDGMAFSIPVTNTGMTPVVPIGFLTLTSVLGKLTFGAQIPFGNGIIEPGVMKAINVLVPTEVPDADWNVHAEIHQGSLFSTSDSIVTLDREITNFFNSISFYRYALAAVSSFLLLFIFSYLRRSQIELRRLRAADTLRKKVTLPPESII